jgi:UDP-2,4-diacetamido-2,4,6-trideoxy-beta-L-altropyranose hydrolase
MRAVFRCDASVSLGIGHVMRCLAFAETLASVGWTCRFATGPETVAAVPALAASGCEIGNANDLDDASIALFDHYGIDACIERPARERGATVVAFDDLADRSHDCAILVDPTPSRKPQDYAPYVPQDCRLMLGPMHAIIRAPWLLHRADSRARLAQPVLVKTIVVSMGGTDPLRATGRVLKALEAAHDGASIEVILGAGSPGCEEIAQAADRNVTLHVDPADPAQIVAGADMVIGAPGTSSFERAVLGMPAILIPLAENQRLVAQTFMDAGAAEIVPAALLDLPTALGEKIAAFVADAGRRATMSRNAAALTDGRGRFRLLAAIAGEVKTRAGLPARLRLAEREDETWLLDLQRQDATRRYALNPTVPNAQEHANWFARILENPQRLLMIVEAEGNAAGMLRLDRLPDEAPSFEVSIAVDSRRHGEGIGAATLALVRRLAPGADLIATVKPENIRSLALFSSAGYRPDGRGRFRSCAT